MKVKEAVEEYQCPGCNLGSDISCYKNKDGKGSGGDFSCSKHAAGTMGAGMGLLFLGLPRGFNRLGPTGHEAKILYIFREFSQGWEYDKFNIPVWKYLDEHGNTLVRGLSPRTSQVWIHIYLENCIDKIDCLEITIKDLDEMD